MKRPKWLKPKLLVLTKLEKGEAVCQTCKQTFPPGNIPGPGSGYSLCDYYTGGQNQCAVCYLNIVS